MTLTRSAVHDPVRGTLLEEDRVLPADRGERYLLTPQWE